MADKKEAGKKKKKRKGCYELAHAQHAVNLGDAEPVQNVRHQRLETHVFDTGNVFGTLEVIRGAILASLAGVVHNCVQRMYQ